VDRFLEKERCEKGLKAAPRREPIDKLLDSPHYGQRWGRHRLGVAHCADSSGVEYYYDRTEAWRYRDYVMRSYNQDEVTARALR
jgi:hypothetical protein